MSALKGRRLEFILTVEGQSVPTRRASQAAAGGRLPRITRLMALAIRFERLLDSGVVKNDSELARFAGVSPARISQIMGLLQLAPDLQEQLLFLNRCVDGPDPMTERELRRIWQELSWEEQRRLMKELQEARLRRR